MKKAKIIAKMLLLMLEDLQEILDRLAVIFLKYVPIVLVTITSMFFLVGLIGLLVIEFKGLEADPSKVRIFFFNVIEGYVLSLVTWLIYIRVWNKVIKFFKNYYDKAKSL